MLIGETKMIFSNMKLHNRISMLLNLGLVVLVTIVLISLYSIISNQFLNLSKIGMQHIQDLSESITKEINSSSDSTRKQFEKLASFICRFTFNLQKN